VKSTYDQVWESALRKLEIRAHSEKELKQKLITKFPDEEEVILRVIEEMTRVHLISDKRFTEEYVHHIIQKPIGRFKIIMETRKRGLNDDIVEQVLLDAGYNAEESALKAIEQKSRVLNEDDERKKKQKLVNFLRNRGFRDSTIYKIFK